MPLGKNITFTEYTGTVILCMQQLLANVRTYASAWFAFLFHGSSRGRRPPVRIEPRHRGSPGWALSGRGLRGAVSRSMMHSQPAIFIYFSMSFPRSFLCLSFLPLFCSFSGRLGTNLRFGDVKNRAPNLNFTKVRSP